MRRASGFRNPTRHWCFRILVFVLAFAPAAALTTHGGAAAQTPVNLALEPASVDENGGPQVVTVRATVPAATSAPIIISLVPVLEQSTAAVPDDLVASPLDQPIIIAAGQTEGVLQVTVLPVNDSLYEGTETFAVLGVGITSREPLTDPVSLEINDDEPAPAITLSTTPDKLDEGGGPQVVTVRAKATVASSASTAITLAPVPEQSTAAVPDDLSASPLDQPLIIAPGQTEGVLEITIAPVDDEIYEGTETFAIRGVGSTGEPLTDPVSLEINDNEPVPAITLSAKPDVLGERDGPQVGVVTATASLLSSMDLQVALVPLLQQSTATLIGPDADLGVLELASDPNVVITIPGGKSTGSINLTIVPVDDDVYETDEYAVFAGSLMGTTGEPVVIRIVDDDAPDIVLSGVPAALREDAGSQTVTFDVALSGNAVPVPTAITLEMAGTATHGTDYEVTGNPEIVIPAGATQGDTQLTYEIVDDDVYEPNNETIVVAARWNREDLGSVALTIIDNYSAPSVVNPISDLTLISGVPFRADLSSTFSGKDLTYLVSTTGDAVSAEISGATLLVTANNVGSSGRVTVAATNAGGSVSYNFGVTVTGALALDVDRDTLLEDGGAQTASFTLELSGTPVSVPTALTLELSGTATLGTDYELTGNPEIVIPAGQKSATAQLGFSVADDAVYEPDGETIVVSAIRDGSEVDSVTLTIVDNFPAPAVTSAISDLTLAVGDSREVGVAGSFSGKDLAFSASVSGDAISAGIAGSVLSVTADRKGSARVTVVATNDAGSISFDFGVTVTTVNEEKMVHTDILAAMGRGILSSVSNTIGGRFSVSAAERQIALGNRRVDGVAAGLEAVISLTGTRETKKYGMDGRTMEQTGRLPVSTRELMRGTSFYYALDNAPQGGVFDGMNYTIWGAGDWNAFEGAASQTAKYDGSLISGYFGMDVSKAGSWMAGVAVGRTMGTSDYDVAVAEGTLEATLNSAYPYVLWQGSDYIIDVWGIGGFGTGEVESSGMASDLSMRMVLIGTRALLAGSVIKGLDLSVIGDAGFASLSTAAGESASLSELDAGIYRVRFGLEGSGTFRTDNGMLVTPFAQVAGRYDGGDGQAGSGLEVASGVHIVRGRTGVEARGRLLAMHSGDEVAERGVSLAAYVKPFGSGGQGFSMAVVPRIGADTDVSGDMWRDEPMEGLRRPSRSGVGMKAEIGYGLAHSAMRDVLVTPFGAMDMAGDDRRRMRLGARFGSIGDTAGALSLELAGERVDGYGLTPDHRIGLIGRMSF